MMILSSTICWFYCLFLVYLCSTNVIGFMSVQPSSPSRGTTPHHSSSAEESAGVDDDDDNDDASIIPNSLTSFDDLGLSSRVLSAVHSQQQWETPTDIQRLAIPQLLSNHQRSVWCQAPTGDGKTLAFGLPLLDHVLTDPTDSSNTAAKQHRQRDAKIRALILCPTRELVVQIHTVLQNLACNVAGHRTSPWKIVSVYGGVRRDDQIEQLASCVRDNTMIDICVATPGRLVDVLLHYTNDDENSMSSSATEAALERRVLQAMEQSESLSLHAIQQLQLDRNHDDGRGQLATLLDSLEYLVIDEADRLLGRSFAREIDPVLDLLPAKLPVWLFSATYPKHIEPRVNTVLRKLGGEEASILRISSTNADRLNESDDNDTSARLAKRLERTTTVTEQIASIAPASTIDLRLLRLEKRDRTQALLRLLVTHRQTWDRVLVFVATRYSSEHVARKLRRVGVRCAEFHGKLDQEARERRLQDLATGKIRVLIATDIGSRGLDIAGLPAVVNYDLPRSTADFVHRVGRTGRAGQPGTAITFVTGDTEAHWDLIEQRHLPPPTLEREVLEGFEVDEERWAIEAEGSRLIAPGATPSTKGLAHDRMFGGVKGRRKSKKDRLREQAATGISSGGV